MLGSYRWLKIDILLFCSQDQGHMIDTHHPLSSLFARQSEFVKIEFNHPFVFGAFGLNNLSYSDVHFLY